MLKAANSRLCNQCETSVSTARAETSSLLLAVPLRGSIMPIHSPFCQPLTSTDSNIHNDMRHSNVGGESRQAVRKPGSRLAGALGARTVMKMPFDNAVSNTCVARPHAKYLYRMSTCQSQSQFDLRLSLTFFPAFSHFFPLSFFLATAAVAAWHLLPLKGV